MDIVKFLNDPVIELIISFLIPLSASIFAFYQGLQAKNQTKEMKNQCSPWLTAELDFRDPYRNSQKGIFNQEEGLFHLESADSEIYIKLPTKDTRTKVSHILITIVNNGIGPAYNLKFYKFNNQKIKSYNFISESLKVNGFIQISIRIEHDSKKLPLVNDLWIYYETISHRKYKQCFRLYIEQDEFLSLKNLESTTAKKKLF